METLQQNFNLAGVRQFMDIIMGNQKLAMPHLYVRRMEAIDWKKLKSAGLKGCVFDKDNTLTKPYSEELHESVNASLCACREAFGSSVVLFSNSAGLKQYDPDGEKARKLEDVLGIPVLCHSEKKPSGGSREIEEYFGCQSAQIAMIGDRLLTDVVFGNLNGMFTVYVQPLEPGKDPPGVRLSRSVEDWLWSSWTQQGIQPPKQLCAEKLSERSNSS